MSPHSPEMIEDLDIVALVDDLDADDPASITVRAALAHCSTEAEALFFDPDEGGSLDQAAIDWFIGQGVPIDAIASPIAIRAARVRIDCLGRYVPDVLGELVFVLPVLGPSGGIIDWAAWVPRTGEIATRLGIGSILGGELVSHDAGDGVTIPPSRMFGSPFDWLHARRQGSVILDAPLAAIMLAGVQVDASDREHADELRRVLHAPAVIVRSRPIDRWAA